jgi:hypothetical protein
MFLFLQMLGSRRIRTKRRQHLHSTHPTSAGYQVEFGGDVVRAGDIAGRL